MPWKQSSKSLFGKPDFRREIEDEKARAVFETIWQVLEELNRRQGDAITNLINVEIPRVAGETAGNQTMVDLIPDDWGPFTGTTRNVMASIEMTVAEGSYVLIFAQNRFDDEPGDGFGQTWIARNGTDLSDDFSSPGAGTAFSFADGPLAAGTYTWTYEAAGQSGGDTIRIDPADPGQLSVTEIRQS